ncbi:MAG: TIGR03905 family TSCPD domain-containing protein [Firmicutes bacterium]|nr:TIGR03905 family TSCPD domain-containing protein [Bacillota bacterium]
MDAYRTKSTCARQIIYSVDENNCLTDLKFLGGCPGGLQAIAKMVIGKPIDEIIEICKGIRCKNDTSCPDQLAAALEDYKKAKADEAAGIVTSVKYKV